MNRVYGIFGAVSGIVTSLFLYFYYQKELYTMRENNLLFRSFKGIVLALCIVFAIIAAKKINGNTISFMRSMFTGFMVSLINGLLYSAGTTIIYLTKPEIYIKPEQFAKEQFKTNPDVLKDTTINMTQVLENIHTQFTPAGSFLPNIIGSILIGLLVSTFVTAFVYTRTSQPLKV